MKRRRVVMSNNFSSEKEYIKSILFDDTINISKSDRIFLLSQYDSKPPGKDETYLDWIERILYNNSKSDSII